MSNYSTKKPIERDNVYSHRTKSDISKAEGKLISQLFFSLAKAKSMGIETDHSRSDASIKMLDIYQVQQAIVHHSGMLFTHMEIISALQQLDYPKLMQPSTICFKSEVHGGRIDAIRLDYSTSNNENSGCDTCDAALNTWKERMEFNWKQTPENLWPEFKLDMSDDGKEGLDICDASRRWIARALELEHQVVGDKETISKLENTIDMLNCEIDEMTDSNLSNQKLAKDWKDKALHIHENLEIERMTSQALRITVKELLETIQAADKEARISLPSAVLLKLLDGANEFIDTPF